MSNSDRNKRWQEEQDFYQQVVERGVVSLDEAQVLRLHVPLETVRKLLGTHPNVAVDIDPGRPLPALPHVDLVSPGGIVWRLTITDEGRARTTRVEN